jgi:hypothetical protein
MTTRHRQTVGCWNAGGGVGFGFIIALAAVAVMAAPLSVALADELAPTAAGKPAVAARCNYDRPFEPPTRSALIPLPPGAVEPEGWLRDWCITARDNYTSRMNDVDDEFRRAWAADYKLPADKINSWSQGAWPFEGGGYWFDGLAGLAFALHDKALTNLARSRFHAVADNMNPDSVIFMWWLSRKNPKDMDAAQGIGVNEPEWAAWANGLFGRALAVYYDGSGDKAALKTLETAYSGDPRWVRLGWSMSNAWPALQTYTWTGNKVIKQALTALFEKGGINQKEFTWTRYRTPPEKNAIGSPDHGVHFCESTTPWALGYLWTGNREFLDAALAWHDLIADNCMQPFGVPVFDEYWGPTGAFRGTETCDVGAYMWSQSILLGVCGQGRLADRMERAFFNAVPAVMARDFKTHVYMQSPNRIADKALPEGAPFTYEAKHYPLCCTAVTNRLLPTYVKNMWMATRDNGLAATCYGPCKVSALAGDHVPVELACKTDYPFNDSIEIAVKPQREATFSLSFRIPGWCKNAEVRVNDSAVNAPPDANGFVRVERAWKAGDQVRLEFPMSPRVTTGRDANAGNAPYACVSMGPLLFALSIPDGKDANTPEPGVKWQYALDTSADTADSITVERGPMPARWDWPLASPLRLRVAVNSIDWKPTPKQPLPAEPFAAQGPPGQMTLDLIPYGCTKLRVSMFPVTQRAFKGADAGK